MMIRMAQLEAHSKGTESESATEVPLELVSLGEDNVNRTSCLSPPFEYP
jgi:hypothetical protein